MADPQDRPGRAERRAAAAAIRRAYAEGRIVAADQDLRLEQVEQAQTNAELGRLTADIAAPVQASNPYVGYAAGPRGTTPPARFVVPVVLLVVLTGVGAAAYTTVHGALRTVHSASQPEPIATPEVLLTTDVLSADGFTALLQALRKTSGGTKVYDVALYDGYALVRVPGNGDDVELYRWGGTLVRLSPMTRTSADHVFDLATVEPQAIVHTVAVAHRRFGDGTTYVVVRPDFTSERTTVIYAYVAGEGKGRGGFVTADVHGRLISPG